MKTQDELNQQNKALKAMSAKLVALLKGDTGKKLLDATLTELHGRTHGNYGDTSMPRNRRIAEQAQDELISALEAVVTQAPPHKQRIPEDKLRKAQEKCRDTEGNTLRSQVRAGNLRYEILVAGEHVAYFFANNQAEAKTFAKGLRLGKHEVKRVTKNERMNRSAAHACSPESETYWSS